MCAHQLNPAGQAVACSALGICEYPHYPLALGIAEYLTHRCCATCCCSVYSDGNICMVSIAAGAAYPGDVVWGGGATNQPGGLRLHM